VTPAGESCNHSGNTVTTRHLADLVADHRGSSGIHYLDVSFEESLRRHATRPQAAEFGPDDMRQWYRKPDLLNLPGEHLVTRGSSLNDTVQRILADAFSRLDGPS
jgi:hypothetical protein